jgi:hypothetical protein
MEKTVLGISSRYDSDGCADWKCLECGWLGVLGLVISHVLCLTIVCLRVELVASEYE